MQNILTCSTNRFTSFSTYFSTHSCILSSCLLCTREKSSSTYEILWYNRKQHNTDATLKTVTVNPHTTAAKEHLRAPFVVSTEFFPFSIVFSRCQITRNNPGDMRASYGGDFVLLDDSECNDRCRLNEIVVALNCF